MLGLRGLSLPVRLSPTPQMFVVAEPGSAPWNRSGGVHSPSSCSVFPQFPPGLRLVTKCAWSLAPGRGDLQPLSPRKPPSAHRGLRGRPEKFMEGLFIFFPFSPLFFGAF